MTDFFEQTLGVTYAGKEAQLELIPKTVAELRKEFVTDADDFEVATDVALARVAVRRAQTSSIFDVRLAPCHGMASSRSGSLRPSPSVQRCSASAGLPRTSIPMHCLSLYWHG